jgi:hypothetical protein
MDVDIDELMAKLGISCVPEPDAENKPTLQKTENDEKTAKEARKALIKWRDDCFGEMLCATDNLLQASMPWMLPYKIDVNEHDVTATLAAILPGVFQAVKEIMSLFVVMPMPVHTPLLLPAIVRGKDYRDAKLPDMGIPSVLPAPTLLMTYLTILRMFKTFDYEAHIKKLVQVFKKYNEHWFQLLKTQKQLREEWQLAALNKNNDEPAKVFEDLEDRTGPVFCTIVQLQCKMTYHLLLLTEFALMHHLQVPKQYWNMLTTSAYVPVMKDAPIGLQLHIKLLLAAFAQLMDACWSDKLVLITTNQPVEDYVDRNRVLFYISFEPFLDFWHYMDIKEHPKPLDDLAYLRGLATYIQPSLFYDEE